MASKQTTADFLLEQLAEAGEVSVKKMFGEYGIYCDGKFAAVICDDELYFKPTEAGRKFIKNPTEKPPYPDAKPYFLISGEKWDDAQWLSEALKITAADLPKPKKKR